MLELINVNKSFQNFNLRDVCLQVKPNDYLMITGRSGAGKSILLELIAGIRSVDSGQILLNGNRIDNVKMQNRGFGFLFQENSIFPHKTVFQNITYALSKKSKPEKIAEFNDIANVCGISNLRDRYPETLSGGEIQRVILARTLVLKPKILLLDEPLQSLDDEMKMQLVDLLKEINTLGQTIIHVSHDMRVVEKLANKTVVMKDGLIV